ncbi:MAG TPA: hypothetical protein VGF67_22190 [Ktedonobacteraceae bacterium]|jgi:hypothetical protein
MFNKFRGRNLAHPGCLIGTTAGLVLGIILAGVLATLNVALTADLLIWLGLTVVLGVIGWVSGSLLSSRFPALEKEGTEAGDARAD